jgi:trehalose 6-phosphate phosphatase
MTVESAIAMSDLSSFALLLDVDGTLLEIAETPQSVRVSSELLEMLRALSLKTRGALGLVSGRSIADLDALFAPLVLPSAGLHGFERRSERGEYQCLPLPDAALLQSAREALHQLASVNQNLLVEDKQFALALHYRRVPELAQTVVDAMREIAAGLQPDLVLQLGEMVAEFRPAASDKGAAVKAFLAELPFHGRCPIYIGDDLTDEAAFECVNEVGGISIAVNVRRPTAAQAALPDVAAVHDWLRGLPLSFGDIEAWTKLHYSSVFKRSQILR